MCRVNLFIIGVNKSGTSWLYHLLAQHPDVFMSAVKELYFFGDGTSESASFEAYHDHFPFDESYRYFGEATPMYYREPTVAEEIHRYNPDARLLAIVRDPIERLLSQYRYHKQLGILEEDTTVEEALDGRDPMLVRDSHYERTLPAFEDQFGPDQFTVLSLEAGKKNPEGMWRELLHFLDLPTVACPDPETEPENPTGSAAFRSLYRRTARPIKRHAPRLYNWMLQSALIRQVKLALIRLLGTAESASLSASQKARLQEEFAPTYAYLRRLGFEEYDSGGGDA
ncbi:MAG: sulfotransferase family protein [Salinivenus sp.]